MPQNPTEIANAGFVRHWRRVGPRIAEVARQELRDYRHSDHLAEIDALLQIAVDHGEKRTTSGLVELQRLMSKFEGHVSP